MSKPTREDIITSPEAETFLQMVTKDFYNNSFIGLWIYEAIGREWDEMREWSEGLKKEIHPQTCTWSIPIWEWVYDFPADETLPLEYRRQRILAKIVGVKPINPEVIRRSVAALIGAKPEDMRVDQRAGPYRFKIHIAGLDDAVNTREVRRYVREIKPSHLAFDMSQRFDFEIDQRKLELFALRQIIFYGRVDFWGFRKLDGTWHLDGMARIARRYGMRAGLIWGIIRIPTEERMRSDKINFRIQMETQNRFSLKQEYSLGVDFWKRHYINGSWQLNGEKYLDFRWGNDRASVLFTAKSQTTEDFGGVEVATHSKNYWLLTGEKNLDGTEVIDSIFRKEIVP